MDQGKRIASGARAGTAVPSTGIGASDRFRGPTGRRAGLAGVIVPLSGVRNSRLAADGVPPWTDTDPPTAGPGRLDAIQANFRRDATERTAQDAHHPTDG